MLGGLWLGWWARGQGIVVPQWIPPKKAAKRSVLHTDTTVEDVDNVVENPYVAVAQRMEDAFVAEAMAQGRVVDQAAIQADIKRILNEAGV